MNYSTHAFLLVFSALLLNACIYSNQQAPISDRTTRYVSDKQVIPRSPANPAVPQPQTPYDPAGRVGTVNSYQQAPVQEQGYPLAPSYPGQAPAAGEAYIPGRPYPASANTAYPAGQQAPAGAAYPPFEQGIQSQQRSPYAPAAPNNASNTWEHPIAEHNPAHTIESPHSIYETAPDVPRQAPVLAQNNSTFKQHPDEARMNNSMPSTADFGAVRPEPQKATELTQTPQTAPVVAAANPTPAEAKQAILQEAASKLDKNDLDGAVASLEKALRMDSGNSKILFDIANIRYHQGRYRDAETFASRAVSHSNDAAITRKAWELIADSRKALGNNIGAEQALRNVQGQ